jgi:Ca2+-binding RTX toxin-like protein
MPLRRLTGGLAVAIVASTALVGAASTAVARQETCFGQPATHVGTPGRPLHATSGPDVIVSNGVASLNAGAGDDLICVTGSAGGELFVNAGPGDDVLDTTAAGTSPFVELTLGAGADRFQGGPLDELVHAGTQTGAYDSTARSDHEVDLIDTGDGDDIVGTGDPTAPNSDVVRLGPGDDAVAWAATQHAPGGLVDGGDGHDFLTMTRSRGAWVLDNAAGRATRDGVLMAAWSGLELFDTTNLVGAPGPIVFVGSDADEVLQVASPVQAAMAGGDDLVEVARPGARGSYDGGPGADALVLVAWAYDLRFDMPSGRLVLRTREGSAVRSTATGFDRFLGASRRSVQVRGTPDRNLLVLVGCDVRADAGAGRDDVRLGFQVPCGLAGVRRLEGGPGADVLTGSGADDVLLGGAGSDRALGRRGDDRCRAERREGCER